MAYENIDLSKAGPLGREAYERVSNTLAAVNAAFDYANFLLFENDETRGNPAAKQMVDEIQALLVKTYTIYRIDDAAWKTYVYESRNDMANAQAEYAVVVSQTDAIQSELDRYVAKEAYYQQQIAATQAALEAEAAALEAANQAAQDAAWQAYLQSVAEAEEKARQKEIARQQKAAAEAAAAAQVMQPVIEQPIDLFPEGSPVFPGQVPYMPGSITDMKDIIFEIDSTPAKAQFMEQFSGFGFDPRLVAYLAKQAELSTVDAGIFYQWNPDSQTFTGFTMAGPVTVTLETMLQRAGIKPVPGAAAQPFDWFKAEQFASATAIEKARAYATYRSMGKTDAEIRQAAEYVFGPQRNEDWQVLQQMAAQMTSATQPVTQPAGAAGAIALAALAAALFFGA
jgi:chemotaxis protein histidine kinase CheA